MKLPAMLPPESLHHLLLHARDALWYVTPGGVVSVMLIVTLVTVTALS